MFSKSITCLLGVYSVMSAITFVVFAIDKSAARRQQWRISERLLHLLSLLGGWPGAWLAQRVLRHKSSKWSFQVVFWLIVAIHAAAWFVVWRSRVG